MKRPPQRTIVMSLIALSAIGQFGTSAFAQSNPTDSADPSESRIDLYRADSGRTGYDPVNVLLPLSVTWRLSGMARPSNPASIVSADNAAYYGSGTNIIAISLLSGLTQWTTPTPDNGAVIGTPCLSGNNLYVGSIGGSLYKIDRITGEVLWTHKTNGGISSAPVVSGGLVFFGSQDSNCYALDAATGNVAWQFSTDAPVTAPPCVADEIVIFASSDDSLTALVASNGRKEWSLQLGDDPSVGAPALSANAVYAGAGQWLYSFLSRSGGLRWKVRFDGAIVSAPAVAGNAIFEATDDNTVYCLSDRGQIRWKKVLGSPATSGFLVTNNALFCGTKKGAVYAFDPATGRLIWDYAVQPDRSNGAKSARLTAVPVFVNGILLVPSDDGALTAFSGKSPDNTPPRISNQDPAGGSVVASKNLKFSAQLVDDGTGINPSTVQFLLDGSSLPLAGYAPDENSAVTDRALSAALKLNDGTHVITLKALDWRGNSLTTTWGFTVDHELTPPDAPTSAEDSMAPAIQPDEPQPDLTPTAPDDGTGTPPPPPPMMTLP